MRTRHSVIPLVLLAILLGSATAQEKKGDAPGKKGAAAKTLPGITPEREAAVMTFVKQHHPELAELLIHLKENAPREYDRAVRDLLRTSERLAQIQEKDSPSYDLELKLWQARSRAQLFAARLQMSDNEELRQQLRATLQEEYDLRLQQLLRDRDRAEERRKMLADQIDKRQRKRDEEIERQFRQLTGGSGAKTGTAKPKAVAKQGSQPPAKSSLKNATSKISP